MSWFKSETESNSKGLDVSSNTLTLFIYMYALCHEVASTYTCTSCIPCTISGVSVSRVS